MATKASLDVYRDSEIENVPEKVTLMLVDYPVSTPANEILEIQRAVSGVLVETPGYVPEEPNDCYFVDRYSQGESLPLVELHTFTYFFAIRPDCGTRVKVERADNSYISADTPDGEKNAKLIVILPNSLEEVRPGLLEKLEKGIARNLGYS